MSGCEEDRCFFNSNNECWLVCKNKFYNQALEDFSKWLVKYKVIADGAMQELLRDFKGENDDK